MNIMKKSLVLDLDNTLWGGVLGEDGPDGIALGFDAKGASFLAFQQAILDLYNRGVILAINSKNTYEDAMRVIRSHPNMVLKENNFAAIRINWNDKAANMREIAAELNIGLDSFLFLDDDPVNREMMREVLPEVETPELPDNATHFAKFLMDLPYFKGGVITDEDKMRGNLYVTERLRKAAEKDFASPNDFLKSLEIEAGFYQDERSNIARLAQLTEKTNQFNMNKTPLSEDEISKYIDDPNHLVIHAEARDKFGDYGIIGFAVINKSAKDWRIRSMLMSCRALGRGIEEAFLDMLAGAARENNAVKLRIAFAKTEKNEPAEIFLNKYFTSLDSNPAVKAGGGGGGNLTGFTDYYYDLVSESIMPAWIKTSWKK